MTILPKKDTYNAYTPICTLGLKLVFSLVLLIILRALGNTKILPAKEPAVPVAPELVVPATAELSTNV